MLAGYGQHPTDEPNDSKNKEVIQDMASVPADVSNVGTRVAVEHLRHCTQVHVVVELHFLQVQVQHLQTAVD